MTLTSPLLLPGVDQHGRGYRVRLRFKRLGVHTETGITTPDQANARSLELRALRDAGLEPDAAPDDPTLGEVGEALKLRKATRVSKKTGRKLRPASITWWNRIIDPWIEEFGATPVSLLRRATVEDAIAEVALDAVKEANNRLVGIKAILKLAEARGATVDRTIVALDEIPHTPRERVALTATELQYLADHAPEHGRRLLLFKGTVGNRWRELATWTDERFDPKARTMFVPAGLCKEGVDKLIDLTPAEVAIAIENQLERAPGSRHVFPTATGMTWDGRYGDWHRDVWQKAVGRAAHAWRSEHDLDPHAPTPFEWPLRDESDEPLLDADGRPVMGRLKPHDLRATAITLMRDAGFTKAQVVARVGHADDGELIDRIYDRGDRRARADVAGAIAQLPGGSLLGGEDCRTAPPYKSRPALVSTVSD